MSKHFFTIICMSLMSISAAVSAQTKMVWDSYGLGFTLSRGLVITQNDGEVFSAEKSDLFLTIQPVDNGEITESDLAELVIIMATEMEYESISDADELELNDLYGYYVEGSRDGASAFVVALMDVESSRNFLSVVVFTNETRDIAIKLIRSFYAYDEE